MDIMLNRFKRLPLSTILAAKNYGMDNICVPESADISSQLCMAILRGDNTEFTSLIGRGAEIDYQDQPDGWTPLIYSIYYNNATARKNLLELGADVNQADFSGRTPLMFAAIKNQTAFMIELIRRGALIFTVDRLGKSALDFAIEYQNQESIILLTNLENITAGLRNNE